MMTVLTTTANDIFRTKSLKLATSEQVGLSLFGVGEWGGGVVVLVG